MEQPDIRRPFARPPLSGDTLQESGQPSRLADESDRLALFGQPARLLKGQPRLAAARPADDGETVLMTQELKDASLVLSQRPFCRCSQAPSTRRTSPPSTSITAHPAPEMSTTMSASYSFCLSCTRKLWKSTASSGSWSRRTAQTPSPKSGWAGTRIGTLQYYQLVGLAAYIRDT